MAYQETVNTTLIDEELITSQGSLYTTSVYKTDQTFFIFQIPVDVTRDRILLFIKVAITVLSCFSNIFTFSVLVYGKLYKNNMYMLALLITSVDLVLSCVHMPISIVVSELGTAVNGTTLCVFNALSSKCVLAFTLLCQVAYNVDRFFAIRWPYVYIVKVTKLRILIIWMTTAGVLLVVNICTIKVYHSDVEFLPLYDMCMIYIQNEAYYKARLRYLLDIAITFIGYGTIFYTSYKVSIIARRHRRQMTEQDRISGTTIQETDASNLAAFQSVFLTSVLFVITGMPRIILLIFPAKYIPYSVTLLLTWLFYGNSICNTVIYGYKFKRFRLVARKLLRRCFSMNNAVESIM